MISLVLPVYLTAIGFSPSEIGVLATSMLMGSAVFILAMGSALRYWSTKTLLVAGAGLMVLSGLAFPSIQTFWPLLAIAFLGTINPSTGDASLFQPVEHARLAHAAADRLRTSYFAVYTFCGSLAAAFGALSAAIPEILERITRLNHMAAIKTPFLLYAMLAGVALVLYLRLPDADSQRRPLPRQVRLHQSRKSVVMLTALFSLDAFAGGFVVNSLLALWLFHRYGLDLATAGTIFFFISTTAAFSLLAAPRLARTIGLVNTMVFTHLPASAILAVLPFVPTLEAAIGLLILRALLSQLDVPTRTSYLMAIVTPGERAAAASLAAAPRGFMLALSPAFAGMMMTTSDFGWPLIVGGGLKMLYDFLFLLAFRRVKPPEEASR